MTVVAFDGKTLAADGMAVSGGGIARRVTKIERHKDMLLAVTGGLDIAAELREWFKAGADPRDFPPRARDGEATLIVFDGDGIKTYVSGPFPMRIHATKCAFGSGRDYAEAAMFLGCDAAKAVEVASHFQTDCGMGVDVLEWSGPGSGYRSAGNDGSR